jgi:hypothetical protein
MMLPIASSVTIWIKLIVRPPIVKEKLANPDQLKKMLKKFILSAKLVERSFVFAARFILLYRFLWPALPVLSSLKDQWPDWLV